MCTILRINHQEQWSGNRSIYMSKEFYINYQEQVSWTEATSRFGSMTYDDVLIVPRPDTKVKSREHVDTSVTFGPYNLSTPIVTAPMDTISGERMIREMHRLGAIGTLPRGDLEMNLQICERLNGDGVPCLYSVGLKDGFAEAKALKEHGAKMILLDIAH